MKVYPKVHKFLKNKKLKLIGPVIESYKKVRGGSELMTTYYFPVEN
jgi:hypothetical protein